MFFLTNNFNTFLTYYTQFLTHPSQFLIIFYQATDRDCYYNVKSINII